MRECYSYSAPGATVRDPRVRDGLDRHTDSRVPEIQQRAKENPFEVQSGDRESSEEQHGDAARVLRLGEPAGAAVPRAHEERRGGGGARRQPRRPPRRAARRRQRSLQGHQAQEV